jgi:HAMP domain-containing protein
MKARRFFLPTVFSIAIFGLVADHLYLKDSPWSVVGVLGKIAAVFAAIFAPAFSPEFYRWVDEIAVPASMIVLSLLLLLLSIARAKKAMRRATPDPDVEAPLALASAYFEQTQRVPETEPGLYAPVHPRRYGLLGKLTVSFGMVGGLFGVAVCIIVYAFLSHVIEKEIRSRADVMLFGVSEMLAGHLPAGNMQMLGDEVAKHAKADAVAYIYVEDGDGKIIAHAPKDVPIYLDRDFPRSAERALSGINIQYRGVGVYEIAKRIGTKRGFVHLGLLRGVIAGESRWPLASIMAAIIVLLVGMMGAFIGIGRALNRPFLELVEHADRISRGEFTVPLELKRTDEIGDIARSFERMRSSLHAVVTRLEHGGLPKQSSQ